ncbi:MAG: LamG domain-containing protein [Verrucomicrobiae bacterium]|nr:LamG domain-containing protein [Verrucomicrobiae bacterium]
MKSRKSHTIATLTVLLGTASLLLHPLASTAQTANQVLSLNGTTAYASIPSAPELQNPTEITVEAWIYPGGGGSSKQTFLCKGDGINGNSDRSYEIVWFSTGGQTGPGNRIEVSFFVGTDTYGTVGAPVSTGQWVHVAATYRSSDGLQRLYINGVLAAETTDNASGWPVMAGESLRQSAQPIYFGKLGHPSIFNFATGNMDEVRVWNRVRTQSEIRNAMSCRLTGSEPNLTAYWNFDDGTAADLTGNGHNGTLFGNAAILPLEGEDVVHAGCGRPLLNIRVSQVELCWDTMTTNWYQLQYRSSLTTNQWVSFMAWLEGDGNRFCTNDVVPADQAQRFYRVSVTNAPPQ